MADEKPDAPSEDAPLEGGQVGDEHAPPTTPFDNPYFLPGLLVLGAFWFGYDGWFNPEIESVMFNRYGTVFLVLGVLSFAIEMLRDPPYLLAGWLLILALWLGYLGWLAPESRWNDTSALLLFDRCGSAFFALAAAISGFRSWRRTLAPGEP